MHRESFTAYYLLRHAATLNRTLFVEPDSNPVLEDTSDKKLFVLREEQIKRHRVKREDLGSMFSGESGSGESGSGESGSGDCISIGRVRILPL